MQGSLVSAARGHLEGRGADRREHLDATFDNVRIDSVEVSARGATYRGVVFDDERHSLPLTLTASRVGSGSTCRSRCRAPTWSCCTPPGSR